jgi:membrane protein YqaA with SNARE-associated domain
MLLRRNLTCCKAVQRREGELSQVFKALYRWTLSLAESRHAPLALGAIAFAESSFFPVPPDVILVPMSLAQPKRAWFYAALCTVASVLGGIAGYAIGALLYDTVGQWLINLYGLAAKAETMREEYARIGAYVILLKGLTPIPFKLVTIVSGLAGYSFGLFVICSVITRGARFFLLAALLNHFGDQARALLDRYFGWFMAIVLAFVVLGFALVKFVL